MKIKISIAVIVIVAVLLIVPLTRNILREELNLAPYPVVANDYLAQLAQATNLPPETPSETIEQILALDNVRITRLRKLIARYPNRPEGYAILFENEQLNNYGIWLDPWRSLKPIEKADQAQEVKQFLIDIETARKIDPSNGFFLTEKALGLLIENRNSEGLNCIASVPQCPKWDDYTTSLYFGHTKNAEASRGWLSAADNVSALGWILYPQYGNYNKIARYLLQMAVLSERAGDIEKGYRIRKIVRSFGKNMAVRSNIFFGALVGLGLEELSLSSTPSAALGEKTTGLWRNDEYARFLSSRGKTAEVAEIDRTQAEIQQTHDVMASLLNDRSQVGVSGSHDMETTIANQAQDKYLDRMSIPAVKNFALCYLYSQLLIIGAAFALVLAVLFGMIRKITSPIEKKSWAHAVLGGLIAGMLIVSIAVSIGRMNFSRLGFFYDQQHSIGITPLDLLTPPQPYIQIDTIIANITHPFEIFDPAHITNYPNIFLEIVFVVQLIIAIFSTILSYRQGKSEFLAFSGSFANSSLAAIALFVCIYLALLPAMLIDNQKANWHIAHNATREVQYAAELNRIVWPPKQ